ncbi:MAG: hypothetical protein GXO75_05970 [Calditrichaeota bacterium]|nr:hypothetical protein [Calditrichota bacterium]
MSQKNTASKLGAFVDEELKESQEIVTPVGSFLDLDSEMTDDNPHTYLRSFKDITPEDAMKKLTFFDRLFYSFKKLLFIVKS